MKLTSITIPKKGIDYLYPSRPALLYRDSPEIKHFVGNSFVGELKVNDSHLILVKNGDIKFYDRKNKLLCYSPSKRLLEQLQSLPDGTILDGGLLHSKHTAFKDKIVFWDILYKNNILKDISYGEHRKILENLLNQKTFVGSPCEVLPYCIQYLETKDILIAPQIPLKTKSDLLVAYDYIDKNDPYSKYLKNGQLSNCMFEGLVVKDLESKMRLIENKTEYSNLIKIRRASTKYCF